jgi:Na+-driven multidrug efflux pump
MLQGFYRNDGSPKLVTGAVISSTAVNVFLDWLFIFPLQAGFKGAAIDTGASHAISLFIVLSHFIRGKGSLRIRPVAPNFALWRKIVIRGLPEMTAQFSMPVTTFCMNYVLLKTIGGVSEVNAFAIINYVASFSSLIFSGAS